MFTYNQLIFPSHMEKNTRFLVLAGFSLSGPSGTPFIMREETDPIDVLGNCRLADNARMAMDEGITPLILRLNGAHGKCVVTHETLGLPILEFTTLDATDESNHIDIHVLPTHLIVKGLSSDITYLFADYNSLDALVSAIKRDLYFGAGEVDVEIVNEASLAGLCLEEKYVSLQGADDGYNYVSNHDETDSTEKIASQLQLLRDSFIDVDEEGFYFQGELSNFEVDTLIFTDIAYEKAPVDLAYILGGFAAAKTEEQSVFCSVVLCSDYFSTDRYDEEGLDLYNSQVTNLLNLAPNAIQEKSFLEHIEVVVGIQNAAYSMKLSAPCASSYAIMRYNLPNLYISATNQALFSTNTLYSKELTQNEVAKLSESGYICIVPSIRKGFVPFHSQNLYPLNTLHAKPHYLRSVHSDVRQMGDFFNQYIGEPFNYVIFQTIISQITNFINQLVDDNPVYQNINLEVLNYTDSKFSLVVIFQLYGEVEVVRTSFEYIPSSEVMISWT